MIKYKRRGEVLHAEVGDDVVALHVDRGQSYGMENVTAAVWRMLAEPTDLESICEALQQRYEVSPDTCRSEVGRLLERFESEGLVERV